MLLRVASYNVHSAIGRDRRFEPQRILDVIHELGAHVIALQEVEAHDSGGDLLAWLAQQTGMRAIAGTTLKRGDKFFGNGLLTRCEVKAIRLVDLSFRNREPRGAIDVDLSCEGSPTLRVVATHLGLRPAERREQVERLLKLFSWDEQARYVLMGDLNEWFLWGRPLRHLHRYFDETQAVPTYPSGRPVFALDRLWAHPASMLRELKAHVSPLSRVASDHVPLVGTLEV